MSTIATAWVVVIVVVVGAILYGTHRYEGINHICKTYPATSTTPETRTCEWRLVER